MLRRRFAGILLASCGLALAQDAIHLASLGGRVVDPSGAIVQDAQITARQVETNLTREAVTDHEGRFRLSYLRPGSWEVRVSRTGFSEFQRKLDLVVSRNSNALETMRMAGHR